MTIREAIKYYFERKAEALNQDYMKTIFTTPLSVIIPMNNGIKIFVEVYTNAEFMYRNEFRLGLPNKNGVFKRLSFSILPYNISKLKVPDTIKLEKCFTNEKIDYCVDLTKERFVNQFISLNDGIDENEYKRLIETLWN